MAITLHFHDTAAPKHHDYRLPPWITATPVFKKLFTDLWQNQDPTHLNAFEIEQLFKKTAKKAHKSFNTQKRDYQDNQTTSICTLTAAIDLLRNITSTSPLASIADAIRSQHPDIAIISPPGSTNPSPHFWEKGSRAPRSLHRLGKSPTARRERTTSGTTPSSARC